jgi:hypothetical protein
MKENQYLSKVTGRQWDALNSLYFDCHMTSIAQILPTTLYYSFINVSAPIYLSNNWGGLAWSNGFDSEIDRDVILYDEMGVDKYFVPVNGDIVKNIEETIANVGYCITRVDSYYHEYFEEYYMKVHRTNGHKVTLIDFDEEFFYGIDNLGPKTLILKFRRDLFLEAIYSNIYNVYEKKDTLYYLILGPRYEELERSGKISMMVIDSISKYLNHRLELDSILDTFEEEFISEFLGNNELRSLAKAKNSYTSAYLIETSYGLLYESMEFDYTPWNIHLEDVGLFMEKYNNALKEWRMFKMLVKAFEKSGNISKEQVVSVLKRVVLAEKEINKVIQFSSSFK